MSEDLIYRGVIMLTVTLTKGLPGSGKTTWAKQQMAEHPGMFKRINKDDLRALLDNDRWTGKNEAFVLKVRDQIILEALNAGFHVLIDDTNLHDKHENRIRELVKGKAIVKIQDFTHVSIEECIERDLNRLNSVGERVIRQMYNQFLRKSTPIERVEGVPDAIIVDLDGTLVQMGDRSPYDCSEEALAKDSLSPAVVDVINRYRDTHKIIVVTGREGLGEAEALTKKWLAERGFVYDAFFMRAGGDHRKDTVVKQEIFTEHIFGNYNVAFVLEDRERVVEMYRDIGLVCWQVAFGAY